MSDLGGRLGCAPTPAERRDGRVTLDPEAPRESIRPRDACDTDPRTARDRGFGAAPPQLGAGTGEWHIVDDVDPIMERMPEPRHLPESTGTAREIPTCPAGSLSRGIRSLDDGARAQQHTTGNSVGGAHDIDARVDAVAEVHV